jgi:hypothetical protein
MAGKRHPSMAGIRQRVSHVLGWPGAQLRWIREQVDERLEASIHAAREKYARSQAENGKRVIEVSPPSSRRE